MDRIEGTPQDLADAPAARTPSGAGSQSKVPYVLILVLIAAALFRIVTSVLDRGKTDAGGSGLIRWVAAETATATARGSNRPILYDFTAEWCGPCKALDAGGWSDREVADLVNESYVPTRVVDRMREDGRNPAWIDELQRRYEVSAFPTLVIAAPDGQTIAVAQGFAGKPRLLEFLRSSRHMKPFPAAPGASSP